MKIDKYNKEAILKFYARVIRNSNILKKFRHKSGLKSNRNALNKKSKKFQKILDKFACKF